MQRLQSPESVGARLDKQYGKDLPNVLRKKAEENLGITQPTLLDKAEKVASDVGTGVVEAPAVALKGFRDAYQSRQADAGRFSGGEKTS